MKKEVVKHLGINGNGIKEVEYKPLPGGPSNYDTQNSTKKSEEQKVSMTENV